MVIFFIKVKKCSQLKAIACNFLTAESISPLGLLWSFLTRVII